MAKVGPPAEAHPLKVAPPLVTPSRFLFDAVDKLSDQHMTEKWTGSIKFICLPVYRSMMGLPLDLESASEVDICDYLGASTMNLNVTRLYLDPTTYNQPPLVGDSVIKNPHWLQLKLALQAAAHSSGSPIMCNAGKANHRSFRCKLRNRVYAVLPGRKLDDAPRHDGLINMDKGGRRAGGRSLSKRTRTTQALSHDRICPFHFTVKWDSFGFYITVEKKNYGCALHNYHMQGDLSKLSLPMMLIPEQERETLRSMSEACIGSAVGRNYIFSKLGKFIRKSQIAYFSSDPPSPLVDGLAKSDTECLLEFFEKTEEITYNTLWDIPLDNGETALVSSLTVDRERGSSETNHTDDPDFIEPRESALICRNNPRVPKAARVFVAVAWANKYDIRTFLLFPEVFHADCTCDSNNTNNHLLTFSCRTSTGKQVVFLRVWIPNQKRYMF